MTSPDSANSSDSASSAFPIVGIGASAGGVEALEGFFRGLPANPGLAVVIVTHLNPERESHLHEIVAYYTKLPVHIAADGAQVLPDNVYVLPADAVLGIEGGCLRIHPVGPSRRDRKPVDIFFSALATEQGEKSAGVVLSGGDSDGTLGVRAIKEHGGLTMAQVGDGFGPLNPDMPESAISSGFVDFAMRAEDMGARLAEFAQNLRTGVATEDGAAANQQNQALEDSRAEIYSILRTQTGHDFGGYKSRTFLRRVQRRMHIVQCPAVGQYLERLRQDPQEVAALFRDLLIGVTNFFRDVAAFDALARLVVPDLFAGRGADDSVRVWVPGCATGEEVYSIAILLREHMDRLTAIPRVQIFATDIDERALTIARSARYPAGLLEGVTPARRERFFVPDGGSFVVAKEVRDLCIFSPHSVIREPPFSRIDLVSCRNLLIYFGAAVQAQVIPIFHYALRPGGWLFLGTAENVGQGGELFAPVDKPHRIFRRRPELGPAARLPTILTGIRSGKAGGLAPRRPVSSGIAMRQTAENQVLERFAPPFVVVNRDGDVVHFSARTGKFLEAAAGMPSRQILTLARKGLRLELRAALREAAESGRTAVREAVAVEGDDGRVQFITLTVDPMGEHDGDEPLFLVLFAENGPSLSREEARGHVTTTDGATAQLERELREARERLQSMVEEYETALEEVKSSNEELVSVNEELQSTNEELEASKEELQSFNEELHTINAELNSKIEALDRANTDLQNLFESTDIATVFLDCHLVIRGFTPAVTKVFNILPGDRGRPITDLSSRFALPSLAQDMADVLAGSGLVERRVAHNEGRIHYLVRLTPYRDSDQRTKGVVVTFVDVTELTRAEQRQRLLVAELHHRTRNLLIVVQSIAAQTLGKGGTLQSFNERLGALGRVQGMLSSVSDSGIDLAEVIRLELTAHSAADDGRISVEGPSVPLDLETAQVLALAVHELATNALKHGALGNPAGRLSVRWRITPGTEVAAREKEPTKAGPHLALEWTETGVIPPRDTNHRGAGRELIERGLGYALRAQTSYSFGPDNLVCRIEVPLAGRLATKPEPGTLIPAPTAAPAPASDT